MSPRDSDVRKRQSLLATRRELIEHIVLIDAELAKLNVKERQSEPVKSDEPVCPADENGLLPVFKRRALARLRGAALAARADEQHRQIQQGDMRGLYGQYPVPDLKETT
jgi:hypothetical protein